MHIKINQYLTAELLFPNEEGEILGNPEIAIPVFGSTTGVLSWLHLNLESNNEAYLAYLRKDLAQTEPQLDQFLAKAILEKLDDLSLQTTIGGVADRWALRPQEPQLMEDLYAPTKMRLVRPRALHYWDTDYLGGLHTTQFQTPTHPHLRVCRFGDAGFRIAPQQLRRLPGNVTIIEARHTEDRSAKYGHYVIYAIPTRYSGGKEPTLLGQYDTGTAEAIRTVILTDLRERHVGKQALVVDKATGFKDKWSLIDRYSVAPEGENLVGGELDYLTADSLTLVGSVDLAVREAQVLDLARRFVLCNKDAGSILIIDNEDNPTAPKYRSMVDIAPQTLLVRRGVTEEELSEYLSGKGLGSKPAGVFIRDLSDVAAVDGNASELDDPEIRKLLRRVRALTAEFQVPVVLGHALDKVCDTIDAKSVAMGEYWSGSRSLEQEVDVTIFRHHTETMVGKWRRRPLCSQGLGTYRYFKCEPSAFSDWLVRHKASEKPLYGYLKRNDGDTNASDPAAEITSLRLSQDGQWVYVEWKMLDTPEGRALRDLSNTCAVSPTPVVGEVDRQYAVLSFDFTTFPEIRLGE